MQISTAGFCFQINSPRRRQKMDGEAVARNTQLGFRLPPVLVKEVVFIAGNSIVLPNTQDLVQGEEENEIQKYCIFAQYPGGFEPRVGSLCAAGIIRHGGTRSRASSSRPSGN
jgi:hypothetical protein